MKKILPLSPALLLFVSFGFAQTKDLSAELNSLVESERAFSRTSASKGIREAFLTYLADEAIVFRPRPVPGKKAYEERPNIPGSLTWEPVYAEVSDAGDLGYTTGPYEFTLDTSASYGHYVSVWKKQSDGSWRVILDIGITHSRPESISVRVTSRLNQRATMEKVKPKVDIVAEQAGLLDRDRSFSKASAVDGLVAAFIKYSDDDVRLYRSSTFPICGKEAVQRMISNRSGLWTWEPIAADVSRSGDLGYTYGISEFRKKDAEENPGESSSYVRIWRKAMDGTWKVALEIAIPIPQPKTKAEN